VRREGRPDYARIMPERDLGTTVADGFTLAAVGDCITSRPLVQLASHDERFATVVRLLRDASATFGNLETSIVDPSAPGVVPMGTPEDWTVRADPAAAADLRSLGFDLLGRANNHSTDWGAGGLRETARHLDAVGLAHAGAGETLASARAPRYLETPWGRVGLVSVTTTTGNDASPALDAFGEVPARPGVHALGTTPVVTVPGDVMDSLAALREAFPDIDLAWTPNADPKRVLELHRIRYERGDTFEVRFEHDPDDVGALLRSVRQSKQHADLAVLAIHAHQGEHSPARPPAALRDLAHAAIEAGADAVVVSGPHRLAPIEVHAGRAILYGLGNFVWSDIAEPLQGYFYRQSRRMLATFPDRAMATDADLTARLNAQTFDDEEIFRAVLARMRFDGGTLAEIRLHPVELGYGEPLTRSGIPRTASPEAAAEILERLRGMSEPFGATMALEGDTGVIRP
jgi:poly-gamma-glutamate capsule biosynthesis protein CapA/YwtB (metallophosphatase superfamily)